jgi:Trm5-related predicted tRNA methylase
MSWQDLTVDVFLDRIQDMPDMEAKEQIVLRQDRALLELSVLTRAKESATREKEANAIKAEIATVQHDLGRLKRVLTEINERMSRISWGRAVTAVFGQEGYAQCRDWMEANR